MNLKKIFKKEFFLGVALFLVSSLRFVVSTGPIRGSFQFMVAIGLVWFSYFVIYHDYKKKIKLDERESLLFIRTANIATFIFMSFLVGMFFIQNSIIAFTGEPLKEFWIFYVAPVFILVHSLTGYVTLAIDDQGLEK